jgi:Domain of unknown function (DUF4136)
MRFTKSLTFLPAVLFMAICVHGQEVSYNYAQGTNFAAYKTYQWVDTRAGAAPDELIDQSIKRAVDEQLAQKGLTKVESNADLYVSYQGIVREEKGVNLTAMGGGPGFGGWGPWGGWPENVQGQTSTIPVGTLVLKLYDSGKKQLVWVGGVRKTIELKKDPDKNYKNLQKAMAKLFKNYPPQPNK